MTLPPVMWNTLAPFPLVGPSSTPLVLPRPPACRSTRTPRRPPPGVRQLGRCTRPKRPGTRASLRSWRTAPSRSRAPAHRRARARSRDAPTRPSASRPFPTPRRSSAQDPGSPRTLGEYPGWVCVAARTTRSVRRKRVAFRRMVAVPTTVAPTTGAGVAARPTAVLRLGVLACAHAELANLQEQTGETVAPTVAHPRQRQCLRGSV